MPERAQAQDDNDRIVETTTKACAGRTGHSVRYVLDFGVGGTIAIFTATYLY